MTERFTADLLFILIVLLVAAILGFLIGYLLEKGRCRKRIALKDEEIEGLKAKILKLEAEKNDLSARVSGLEEENGALREKARKTDDEIASLRLTIDRLEKESATLKASKEEASRKAAVDNNAAAAEPVPAPEVIREPAGIRQDDLKVVVGIGPKIASLLINRGISTWKILSETSPAFLKEILDKDGGEQFRIHNPEHWPLQARLLHEGRLDEFRELRNRLES
jgi:predicted flap endonuclease-1-like 5' DNA nuclease